MHHSIGATLDTGESWVSEAKIWILNWFMLSNLIRLELLVANWCCCCAPCSNLAVVAHNLFVSILIVLLCDLWIHRPTLSLLRRWEGSGWSATSPRFCPMCSTWSPILVQLRPTWRLCTLGDVCPSSWEQLWAACWGRRHRLQLPKKYVKPLVNKWRQWVRTIFLHSRPVEKLLSFYCFLLLWGVILFLWEGIVHLFSVSNVQRLSSASKVVVWHWLVISDSKCIAKSLEWKWRRKLCICHVSWDRLYWKSCRVLY